MAGSENTTPMPGVGSIETPTHLHVLGQILGGIIAESRRADAAPSPRADALERANDARRDVVERLILATKAASLPDAAVHALHLRHLADDVETAARDGNDEAVRRALWHIERLASSIFDVLAQHAGLDPAELAADYFLQPADRLWPTREAADVFGAALALFAAEADAPAAPPEPSTDVLSAVAGAAGVTAEVVRRVFAAVGGIAAACEEA